ncbi:serine protease inhibitor Kazal-type 7 isoform X1 [Manis javanica]|uniref:serine protease inhibitor Kazal-type 7 isoform X1 n=1 Tax=Manis javanica TaxID=9974 RepID=UPI000813B378
MSGPAAATALHSLRLTAACAMNVVGPLLLLWTGTHFWSSSEAASLPLPTPQMDCSVYQEYPVTAIPCPITYKPICGSDYITYGNECHLCAESLRSHGRVQLLHEGRC